jgi:hypothetical protein
MDYKQKTALLHKSMDHNDWKAVHGRVNTAAAHNPQLKQDNVIIKPAKQATSQLRQPA